MKTTDNFQLHPLFSLPILYTSLTHSEFEVGQGGKEERTIEKGERTIRRGRLGEKSHKQEK